MPECLRMSFGHFVSLWYDFRVYYFLRIIFTQSSNIKKIDAVFSYIF